MDKYKLSRRYPRKRAFITGAAQGLGRELALLLAEDHWLLGLSDIDSQHLQQTKADVEARGGTVFEYCFDVADQEAFRGAAESFLFEVDGIDLLINNAGVGEGTSFDNYSIENWNWIIAVNLMGVVHGCHYFLPEMKGRENGMILNVASNAGYANMPNGSPYNATKAAVISLTRTLQAELYRSKVQVRLAAPTFFNSNILAHSRGQDETIEIVKRAMQKAPMTSQEVARKILYQLGGKRSLILVQFSSFVIYHLQRLFPAFYHHSIGRGLSKKS